MYVSYTDIGSMVYNIIHVVYDQNLHLFFGGWGFSILHFDYAIPTVLNLYKKNNYLGKITIIKSLLTT